MRRQFPQQFALEKRLAHQSEMIEFKVSQAAMNELGRAGRCSAGQIVGFAEADGKSAARGIPGDAASVDAATHDEDIVARAGILRHFDRILFYHLTYFLRDCLCGQVLTDHGNPV